MQSAPLPEDESSRLKDLHAYEILDTPPEEGFDNLAKLAAQICGTPIALISLVDAHRQWFKAKVGIDAPETPRDIAFSAHAIHGQDLFVVPDATQDERFADNPLVAADPNIRFYAGMPLITPTGHAMGTLCVIDRGPKQLSADQMNALRMLGQQVVSRFELKRRQIDLEQSLAMRKEADRTNADIIRALERGLEGVAFINQDGCYTYMNPAHAAIHGYKPDELIGRSWKTLYEREWISRIENEYFPELLDTGYWTGLVQSRTQSGGQIYTELSLVLAGQPHDPSRWLTCTCRDVTERVTSRQQLEAHRTSLDQAQALAHVGSWESDLRTGTETWSDEQFRIFGYEPHSITPTVDTFRKAIHPDDRPRVHKALEDAVRLYSPYDVICRITRPNGEIRHILCRGTVQRDSEGRRTHMLGTVQDITEQKTFEHILNDTIQRLDLATKSGGIGVWDYYIPENKQVWDKQMYELYGYTTENFPGTHEAWLSRLHPEDKANAEAALQEAIEGRKQYDTELRLVLPDQSIRHIKASAVVLKDEQDRPVRMIGINYDITARKAAESKLKQAAQDMEARNQDLAEAHKKALAATRAKSEFLASMSHEIRTPMNAITAMADLLYETPLSTEQQDYVGRLSRAATSLLDLINDILDISKIESGHLELESVAFDIHDLIDRIGELMAIRAHAKQLEIATFVHPEVPTWVSGDPTRLRQVLVNLVGNAIKFTEQGDVVLRIEPNQSDPATLRCSISDTGIGIPADKIESIFESFTQVDSSTTRKYGGTGLGLSICKRLVGLMGGHIGVDSTEGVGSTFSFVVPLPKSPIPVTSSPSPVPDLRNRRLLIVDDNATNRMVVREHLKQFGPVLVEAPDGPAALKALDEAQREGKPFDLAILDYHMANMDGLDLAASLRERKDCASLPLVMYASDMRGHASERARELGIASYAYKPVSRKRLLESLAVALNQTTAASARQLSAAHPESASRPSCRILLVEDLEDNRDVIAFFLNETPYQLDMAENGAMALQMFQRGAYDLVFMDIQVPVMDGLQATAAIRQWEREQQRTPTPIVALTANAFKEEVDKSLAAGCTAHVTKPVKKKTLLDAIAQYAGAPANRAA